MAYKFQILLGRIVKPFGFEGFVTVKLEKSFIENIPGMESVFLDIDGKPVPFFISDSDYPGADILRLKFEGYESFEKASEFAGCTVFLTSGQSEKSTSGHTGDLAGYTVFEPDNARVGTVKETIRNPGQWLLSILTSEGKEILIPMHQDLIIKVDNKKKTIVMDLPDGLKEIN